MKDEMGFGFLLYSRIFRSVAIIFMTLASPLYLSLAGFRVQEIGLVYLGLMLFNSAFSLLIGALGDRMGYRRMLIVAEVPALAGAAIICLSGNNLAIAVAVIVGGIGGLAGGIRGAFSPGLTALTARNYTDDKSRITKLSMLTMVSSFASVGGALLLVAQSYVAVSIGNAVMAYRLLFGFSAVLMLLSMASVALVKEAERPVKSTRIMRKDSFRYMMRIVVVRIINGAGLGLAMPLLPLVFSIAFGLSPSESAFYIGLVYIPSYLATGLGARIAGGKRAEKDSVSIAFQTRAASGILMAAMGAVVLAGHAYRNYGIELLGLVTVLYSARALVAGMGSPAVTALNVKGIHNEDYGTASSVQGVAGSLAQTSTGASGYLMDYFLPLPLFLGGLLQVIGGIAYLGILGRRGRREKKA